MGGEWRFGEVGAEDGELGGWTRSRWRMESLEVGECNSQRLCCCWVEENEIEIGDCCLAGMDDSVLSFDIRTNN
ncbi:unnamed protein product [Linum trigynum]|uniref:Uncharacterized protein n=1 Tax=Linum trigynum TaxID=586398 RepID=A0AAV2DU86_9ROSI